MEMVKVPYKKLVNLKCEQKDGLDDIQRQISANGGDVSIMELIVDSIQIFIDHYKNAAIERYSLSYYDKNLGSD